MNQEAVSNTSGTNKSKTNFSIQINLDEFNISEESFRPMTKGLGFHQDQKKPSYKSIPKDVKSLGQGKLKSVNLKSITALEMDKENSKTKLNQHMPSGLEAFYSAKGTTRNEAQYNNLNTRDKKSEIPGGIEGAVVAHSVGHIGERKSIQNKIIPKNATKGAQFIAWAIDLLVICSFVSITGILLAFVSGIQLKMLIRLLSIEDLLSFTSALFSIYYLLYFTILDVGTSPGKTIMGIRLLRSDYQDVTMKNTFVRALVTLLSAIVLFLPTLLDFQGHLSDTKLVK